MSIDVYVAFNKALFALKPINVADDGHSMELQLFWLSQRYRVT